MTNSIVLPNNAWVGFYSYTDEHDGYTKWLDGFRLNDDMFDHVNKMYNIDNLSLFIKDDVHELLKGLELTMVRNSMFVIIEVSRGHR